MGSEDEEIDIVGHKRSRTTPPNAKEEPQPENPTKRRGRPAGSKNKIKPPGSSSTAGARAAPKTEEAALKQPPPSSQPAILAAEPLTKRAKIQAELQQRGLQPVAIGGKSNAGGAAVGSGISKPSITPSIRPPSQLGSYIPNLSTNIEATRSPLPAATAPAEPTPDAAPNNKSTNNKDQKTDSAPGEALRTWLEENQVVVEEEKLIEELPEDVPLHQPSVEELASNAACAEFQVLLPGLVSTREAINYAAAVAMKVAVTGASARAVRMVVDAASDALGPRERLPYLYLLDSVIKLELRQAQELGGEEEGKKEEATTQLQHSSFRRAIGAALQRLVHLLLGDDQIKAKVEKLLGIWQREELIAASLIGPVMESLELDAARRKKEARVVQAHNLNALLKENSMSIVTKLMYTMPNGERIVLRIPPHDSEPDDWRTPWDLGLDLPETVPRQGAVRKMKFLSSSSSTAAPPNSQSQKTVLPEGYTEKEMSPWCTEERYEAPEAQLERQDHVVKIKNKNHHHDEDFKVDRYFQQQQQLFYRPPPPPPAIEHQQQDALEEGELDEFDQGLLRDAYGIGGGGDAGGVGNNNASVIGVGLAGLGGAVGLGSARRVEEGEILNNPVPLQNPLLMNSGNYAGGVGVGMINMVTAPAPEMMWGDMMQQQQQQQQWNGMPQQALLLQDQMMMPQQMMNMPAGVMGMSAMNMSVNPMQQQQQAMAAMAMAGGYGGGAMGMGMQMPSQQQQQFPMMNEPMMNASMMGDGEYNHYGNAGMQQQQQGGSGRYGGGGGQRGHGRQGGGHHQRDNANQQQHRKHHNSQQRDSGR
jgi:hypothetical protein